MQASYQSGRITEKKKLGTDKREHLENMTCTLTLKIINILE